MAASDRIGPQDLGRAQWAFAETIALLTAAELDLFTPLAAGPLDVATLARRRDLQARALRPLLDVLAGMGFLRRADGAYALAPGAERMLVAGAEDDRLASLCFQRRLLDHWLGLADVVRSGRPVEDVAGAAGPAFFRELVPSLFRSNLAAARTAARELKETLPRFDATALDVAAGSGVFGIALAQEHPGVVVTALDHPEVLEVTRSFVERHGLVGRFHYLAGNLRTVLLPERFFDAAFLGHILHSEGEAESRRLLHRLQSALRPGGQLVIAEFLVDDDHQGPLVPLLFGLNMLIHTEQGVVFSFAELRDWLHEAGFRDARLVEAEAPSPLIVATRG